MTQTIPELAIPEQLLPADGRFGSGPSLVPVAWLERLAASGDSVMGTSHRRDGIRDIVGRIRSGLGELFSLPEGYEVVLGNGGATAFWDMAVFGLIERRSQHLSFGEFSSKFAASVAGAPHLDAPMIIETPPGTHPLAEPTEGIDLYALTHNETSTGVTMPIRRVPGDGLTAVDATSAAAGTPIAAGEFDVYYFSPQKAFGSDGGLFVAICSPAAVDRIEAIGASERWIPPFMRLDTALDNSRKNQTYNTPALATIFLLAESIEWMNDNGGLSFSTGRCAANAAALYGWADANPVVTPFVTDPAMRSQVTATIDFADEVSADDVAAVLRSNGVIDTESYRKLGRNQLRIGLWPSIATADVEALTACIDWIIDQQ
jgi:phosphoserine aminotransferase